jgi:uncharacterized repeat protein (TIGR01451 family)
MQRIFRWLCLGVILSLLVGITGFRTPAANSATWQEKVDPKVLAAAQEGEIEFLIFMTEQADLSGATTLKDKAAKGAYVYEALTSIAETTQRSMRSSLDSLGVVYQSFWIANMLWGRGDLHIIQNIARRSDVAHIYANPQIKNILPELEDRVQPTAVDTVEWNILKINADDVWAAGYTGQGVVIGGQDTGYVWNHPALIDQYRGWDGATADHDYNWFDATSLSPDTPVDPNGHGTHTMGTMVGDDGLGNQVGVAPGARWIGCRNMNDAGWGSPATYAACYQWFVAPTRTDGSDPRPDLAPDVINNSWSCPTIEGCTDLNVLLSAVQAVRAAGILTVHSAGNHGPSCDTVNEPATIYEESFSVGSTTSSDTISNFSSRGPVIVDGSNRFKPQVTAPGSGIRSSTNNGSYGYKNGTSMAAPHVAGLAALVISAEPAFAGRVDELETLIEQSAVPIYTAEGCGGDTHTSHPNHTYGWGRVDAWAAYQATQPGLQVNKTAPEAVLAGDILTYTLTVTNTHLLSITHNVLLTDTLPDQTAFFSATGVYVINGRLISWDLGDLGAESATQVELGVRIPQAISGVITNTSYGAVSQEVTTTVQGYPVSTMIHEPAIAWQADEDCLNQWISPGGALACQHEITNLGNYTDTIQITGSSINGSVEITPTTVIVGSGKSTAITATITVPGNISGGTENTTTLTATSMAGTNVSEPLEITTWVYYQKIFPLIFSGN